MGRRSRKNGAAVQASSVDDAIRAAIIRDAISRMTLPTSAPQIVNRHDIPAQPEPTVKRQKLDEEPTAGYACQIMKPVELAASSTIAPQTTIEERSACVLPALPWPVEDFAAQPSSLQEYGLSPLETEVIWLRAALAQSTEREECLTKMNKTLRIELHKAYRLIAVQQLNSFTCDTEMPIFPGTQH